MSIRHIIQSLFKTHKEDEKKALTCILHGAISMQAYHLGNQLKIITPKNYFPLSL